MKKTNTIRKRTVWVLIIILVFGFGAVITRLAYLQLIDGDSLQRKAVEQQLADTAIDAKRGTIYDKNHKILAQSASVWQLIMAPIYFQDDEQREYVASELAPIINVDKNEILEQTKEQTYYVKLKGHVESDEKDKITELQDKIREKYGLYSVLSLNDDYKRYYPYGDLASTVIGFAGDDGQGLAGIEYQYNSYLTGVPGRVVSSKISSISDKIDMPFEANQSVEAQDGNSLVLTIDETIQNIVEKHMKKGIEDNDVFNRGVCIVMDVKTGEILAMASVNGYDLNNPFEISKKDKEKIEKIDREYLEDKGYCEDASLLKDKEYDDLIKKAKSEAESEAITTSWRNKAISDTYYPGSVFKMVTLSMALQEGVVDKDTTVYCSGTLTVYDKDIDCTGNHGTQSYRDALENSCNPGFMQIGEKVGAEKFWEYYQGFGFSEKTGIDLPGESEDLFFTEDGSMGPVDLAVASFGQNFSITPIQMVTAISAVSNGGYMVQPHVVKQILDSKGNVVQTISTDTKRQVISESVSKEMCDILEENATTGSGKNGYVAGYRIAGKTGTSEKLVDLNDDGEQDYIASYGGFAPAEDAKVACLVFYDTPTGGSYYGSQVSAPVFANIMSEVLPYLEIDAQYSGDEIQASNATAGSYTGMNITDASDAVNNDGFEVSVKGDGDTVLAQSPMTGSTLSAGGTIVLYTDEESRSEMVMVPDFENYSISDCSYISSAYDLNIVITGQSTSGSFCTGQSVEPGKEVIPGTIITLTFSTTSIND